MSVLQTFECRTIEFLVGGEKDPGFLPASSQAALLFLSSLSEILQMETSISWQLHLEHQILLPARSSAMLDENWHPEIIQDHPLPYSEPSD